ncbi:fido domain-containing protein [Lasiosphaeria hispida]|uniref:Fido domain-containing protein n=1 Tax=Lasiosphaeria hispida TaxID=260671 RepID=A0AAJ0HW31_9PEZI|nr:fido domain-containing protein [Lasiosphaeria hispida]
MAMMIAAMLLTIITVAVVMTMLNMLLDHEKTYRHLTYAFVAWKQDLGEDLIEETHEILTKGIPIIDQGFPNIASEEYGGVYRTVVVGAGDSNFSVPKSIPEQMKKNTIDPFSIATKYSMEFVQIHSFRDGNGRMCPMILNTILCRYLGIIVPIGEQGEERSDYMGIKVRASQNMDGLGEFATFVLQRGVTRMREMKKLTGKAKAEKRT